MKSSRMLWRRRGKTENQRWRKTVERERVSPRSDKAVALLKSQQLGLPAQGVHKSKPVNIPACSGGGPKTPPIVEGHGQLMAAGEGVLFLEGFPRSSGWLLKHWPQ